MTCSTQPVVPHSTVVLLQQIEDYARRNLHFADNFLQLARVESMEHVELVPVDMYAVVENAVAQVLPQARGRGIELETSWCDHDTWVSGNVDLLERAVVNLLSNAIKFSDAGGKITASLDVSGRQVVCSVADNGIGIPEQDQAAIFQRFNQGTRKLGAHRSGVGLGLRFVELVCHRHDADLKVSSAAGEGAVFTICLPLLEMTEE